MFVNSTYFQLSRSAIDLFIELLLIIRLVCKEKKGKLASC